MNAGFNAKALPFENGSESVKEALIEAACEMLAESGPKSMSVRKVAARADVNHGQVHHYFGGKQGLIEAAMAQMSEEHYENARRRAGGDPLPSPLTLGKDTQYLQSIVRLVMDGDIDTAIQEMQSSNSVPMDARRYVTRNFPDGDVPIDTKARFALSVAIELGWAALEPYILHVADVRQSEQQRVRKRAQALARDFMLNEIDKKS